MAVQFETQNRVAVITLDRPEARNAINAAMSAGIEAALDRLEDTDDLWVGVLRATTVGERPVFCAGADLKAVNDGTARGIHTARGGFGGIAFRARTKPLIAAVDGLATAGGCEIALACDIIVASSRASFGLAEVKRNLVALAGGLFRLPRALGQSTAMEMALSGEPMSAQRAYELGMVSRVVDAEELDAVALALAEAIAANAPLAVRESRQIVAAAFDADADVLREMGLDASKRMAATEDQAEGVRAFVEKRPPQWKAR